MSLPKSRIPKSLSSGIFNPELIPRQVEVNDLVREGLVIEKQSKAEKKIKNKINNVSLPNPSNVPVPITEAEAEEADFQIQNTQQRIVALRNKISNTRAQIDSALANTNNGKELSFQIDISKKPRVKRALKKLFGKKLDTITYSMYIAMLQAKTALENQEVEDYSKGKTKD